MTDIISDETVGKHAQQTFYIKQKKFMCIGAETPFDHPHVYLNMGESNTKLCPYCSTLFVFDSKK